MNIIHEDNNLRIQTHKNPSGGPKKVLLSFTGIGHAMGGVNVQKPEFFRAGQDYDEIVFITDKRRTWGNGFSFDTISECLAYHCPGAEFDAIGNSMGGFIAVAVTPVISIRTVVAIVPQFSVNARIVPWESRWKNYRSAIAGWSIPSLDGRFVDRTEYYVISGDIGHDGRHMNLFPKQENVHLVVLPGFDHAVAQRLKDIGILSDVVTSCLNRSFNSAELDAALVGYNPSAPRRNAHQKT